MDPENRITAMLLRRGLALEYITLAWNVIGVIVLAVTALAAGSVALAAFGIDSLIEILASTMVIWQLKGTDTADRTIPALRVIALAFAGLAVYITAQSTIVLINGDQPGHSITGAAWLAVTALVMFALARGKSDTGRRLDNTVLRTEARITVVDGALATIILLGVVLNSAIGWWWADPTAALVIVLYAIGEAQHAWRETTEQH
jgi:divalent metal cation (Fe/Co/Zn/Cd) transporter